MFVKHLIKIYNATLWFAGLLVILMCVGYFAQSYSLRKSILYKLFPTKLIFSFQYIPSASMENTLYTGDRTASSFIKDPVKQIERGDIIVFWRYNEENKKQEYYTKRVIGLPGEHIVINDVDDVTINGIKINEPYICKGEQWEQDRYYNHLDEVEYNDVKLSDDEFFVMGDYRYNSNDCRYTGPIKADVIMKTQDLYFHNIKDFGAITKPEYPELSEEN